MTTTVRIYSHRGIVSAHNARPAQAGTETVSLLLQPYLAAETLTAGGAATSSSAATAPANTAVLKIEVADGGTVRIEVNPPQRTVPATAASPAYSGKDLIDFGENWTISVIEA